MRRGLCGSRWLLKIRFLTFPTLCKIYCDLIDNKLFSSRKLKNTDIKIGKFSPTSVKIGVIAR